MKRPKIEIYKIITGILILLLCLTFGVLLFNLSQIEKIGSFGDAFNGLLAPIISLLGALLVYLSFKEQIKANYLLQAQWSFDMYLRMFNDIKESIGKVTIEYNPGGSTWTEYKGKEAFQFMVSKSDKPHQLQGVYESFRDIEPIMKEFLHLVNRVSNKDFQDKDYLGYKIHLYYESEISPLIDASIKYFESNANKVKTIEANSILIITFKQIQTKMIEIKKQVAD